MQRMQCRFLRVILKGTNESVFQMIYLVMNEEYRRRAVWMIKRLLGCPMMNVWNDSVRSITAGRRSGVFGLQA